MEFVQESSGQHFKEFMMKLLWPWSGATVTVLQVIIQAFLYCVLLLLGVALCTALYIWVWLLMNGFVRQHDQDPEDPEDPEAPVVVTSGNVDRHCAGTRHITYESESILLRPVTNTVQIRILPAQSCSTKKGKRQVKVEIHSKTRAEVQAKATAEAGEEVGAKSKAKALSEVYPEACEKVWAKSSAEDQSEAVIVEPEATAKNTKDHQDTRVEIRANTYAETNDQVETESNWSSTFDPLCSALACLCEGSGTSHNIAYLPNGFIPSAPFGEGQSDRLFPGDKKKNKKPPHSSSENSLTAMLNVFDTITTPFSHSHNPYRIGNIQYTRNVESYP